MLDWVKKPVKDFLHIRYHTLHAYSTGLLQGKAYRTLEKHLKHTLDWYEVSILEWKLLGQLCDNTALTPKEIAKRLDCRISQVTHAAKSLAAKKLLHISSKKNTTFTITDAGRDFIDVIEVSVKKTMRDLLEGLSKKQLITYIKVLMTIVDNG